MLSIAAKPYPYRFVPATTALLVIDMQRDFIEPGGFGSALGNDVGRLAAIVPTVRALLDACRASGLPIIHTREAHQPDLSDCPPAKRMRGEYAPRIGDPGPMGRILVAGEPGSAILHELAPLPGETVLDKPGKGAFYATPLESLLRARGVTHLIIAGVTTEVCVQTTMREANDRGYECLLVEDATESYSAHFKQATLEMVRAQGGIVGWTAPSAAVFAALRESRAQPPATATIAPLPAIAESPAVDLPEILAEVTAVFARYEAALIANDAATLNELFRDAPETVRYSNSEILYGYAALAAWRAAVPARQGTRRLMNTRITTYGRDFATAFTEFQWEGSDRVGLQSQSWVRCAAGWRIVAAHVGMRD